MQGSNNFFVYVVHKSYYDFSSLQWDPKVLYNVCKLKTTLFLTHTYNSLNVCCGFHGFGVVNLTL